MRRFHSALLAVAAIAAIAIAPSSSDAQISAVGGSTPGVKLLSARIAVTTAPSCTVSQMTGGGTFTCQRSGVGSTRIIITAGYFTSAATVNCLAQSEGSNYIISVGQAFNSPIEFFVSTADAAGVAAETFFLHVICHGS